MRSSLLSFLAERAGFAMKQHLKDLPWLCLQCEHCRIDEGVPAPWAIRALSDGRLTCSLRLSLPCGGRPCDGFCPAEKTDSDKEQQNSLTAGLFCGVMRAPENYVRRHKSLSGFPRAGQILVCILSLQSTPASFLAGCLLILGRLQRLGTREGQRLHVGRGALRPALFIFPNYVRFFHV